jgi:hypothetical protein
LTWKIPKKNLYSSVPKSAVLDSSDELWLNPGTESPEVLAEAERLGLNVIQACSILGVGLSPSEL